MRTFAALLLATVLLPGRLLGQDAPLPARSIEQWRAEAGRVRLLADNDANSAYVLARRLAAELPPGAARIDHARALNLMARVETYLALTEIAADHARAARDLAVRSGDRVGVAESDLNISLNAINQGHLDEMVAATQNSVADLEGVDRPDLLGEALLRTTAMYRRFDQFDESIAVAVHAMDLARQANNPLVLAYAHQGLGIAYDQSYRYAEAREQYQQMRVQARAAHNLLMEAFSFTGLAGLDSETGELQTAEQLTREALVMFRQVGAPYATSYGLYGLAELLKKQNRYEESLRCLDEALEIYRLHPNRISEWFALNARSSTYQLTGKLKEASADAERAQDIAEGLGAALYLSGSATRLASIAAARGDYKRAFSLSVEASDLTAKAAREKAGPRVVRLINRYESESKQRQIDELTRRGEHQASLLMRRDLQQRWLWTVLAGVILALAGAGFFLLRLRQSESAIRTLNASLEQRVQSGTQEVRRQANYLRTLINTLPMRAWLKDTQGGYLVVNQAQAQACGHTVSEIEGRTDLQLFPQPLAQQQIADDREVMASHQRRTTEERQSVGDSEVWIETYKAPVLDDDGTVLGTVGVARNISDRKSAEEARELALSEARRLARQRSQFLAQMSHELRTPLNAIMGFAQILMRDTTLANRAAKAIRIIDDSAQHLLRLINDLLDLARIDAGKFELLPVETNLEAFLQMVRDTVHVKAVDKGIGLLFEAADLPETVYVDEKRLRQVLLNLLSNAIRFSDSGRVTLRVDGAPAAGVTPAGQAIFRLRFEVADEGIGMSEVDIERAFQPFEQLADTRRREGGAGLGLAISRQLVHLMGGEIEVRSRPGEGSVFTFDIEVPSAYPRQRMSFAQQAPAGYRGERKLILVVDDVFENRALLVAWLEALDFRVAEAANGLEALECAKKLRPELMLIDLAMPRMDGWEAIRRLRSMPQTADMPIIATSASATADSETSSRAAGANAFLGKPIEEMRLLQHIATLLHLEWTYEARSATGPG